MSIKSMFYVGSQDDINQAVNQINANCGFPNSAATTWAIPTQIYQQNLWFIPMPRSTGYRNGEMVFTQAQMILGVVNVDIEPYNPDWFPPAQS